MADWFCLKSKSDTPPSYLADLLQYACKHYAHHTDWYIRHRDAGLKTLAATLTAEFAVVGFAFSSTRVHAVVAVAALLIITILSIPLTYLAILSCTKAYKAALEHAAFITKIVWAMGLCSTVPIPVAQCDQKLCPLIEDPTFFIPRFILDASGKKNKVMTTEEYVKWNLTKKDTTLFATKTTLGLMGGAAALFGVGSALAVLAFK